MKRKQKRLYLVLGGLAVLGIATALVLKAFEGNILFYYDPAMIAAKPVPEGRRIRLGGLVEDGSVVTQGGIDTTFRITDTEKSVPVRYQKPLPALFREGQGVIAEGAFNAEGVFIASQVLAKHDENYIPAEIAETLKKSGQWQGK